MGMAEPQFQDYCIQESLVKRNFQRRESGFSCNDAGNSFPHQRGSHQKFHLELTPLRERQGHRSASVVPGCSGIRLGTRDPLNDGGYFCTLMDNIQIHIKVECYQNKIKKTIQ
jgi:hypothetical protein